MNREFTEVYTVRASAPFSALHEGFVSRFVLWKFRPPYTRTDSEIAAPACIFAYMEKKKERKWKKVWDGDRRKRGRGGGKVLAENDVTCDESSCELRRIVHRENTVNRCHTKSNTVIQLFSLIFKTSRLILNIVGRLSKVSLHVLSKRNLSIG